MLHRTPEVFPGVFLKGFSTGVVRFRRSRHCGVMRNAWRAWQELSGLLLPVACAGCGRPRTELCTACGAALHGAPARLVRPSPRPPGLPAVYAAAPYENAVRAVLLAHKERGALGLAGVLGRALAGCVRAGAGRPGDAGPLLLVPVPSARSSTAARGHDPVRRIAAAAARDLRRAGLPGPGPSAAEAAARGRRPVGSRGAAAAGESGRCAGAHGRGRATPPARASPARTPPARASPARQGDPGRRPVDDRIDAGGGGSGRRRGGRRRSGVLRARSVLGGGRRSLSHRLRNKPELTENPHRCR